MGFMTEVSILNDMWSEIRKNPDKFVEQLYSSSMSNGREPRYIVGQTTVAKTHHADDYRVYYSGCNAFFDAYPDRGMTMDGLKYHLKSLKDMKWYIKNAEDATKEAMQGMALAGAIARGEGK